MTSQSANRCSLSGPPPYDLRGCDLSRVNLGGKDLTNAQLQNSTLLGTVFNGVLSMAGADLSGAIMGNGTDFTGCDLSKVNFGPKPNFGDNPYYLTKFVAATVPHQTLGSTWEYLDLTETVISELPGDLSNLVVTHSNLPAFDFAGRTLVKARFTGVALRGANFAGATLTGATFDPCDLTDASFVGVTMKSGSLAHCVLTRADFTRADFTPPQVTPTPPSVSFAQSGIAGARFDKTDLSKCDLIMSNVGRSDDRSNLTSFRGATLRFLQLTRGGSVWWAYLDLSGATLLGLSADLSGLQAQYAVLTGIDLAGAKLSGANLTGATLAGANFTRALLDNAQMLGVRSAYEIFRVTKPSECDELRAALQQRVVPTVARYFGSGYPLAPARTTIHDEGGVDHGWIVTDASTKVTYRVNEAATSEGLRCLVATDPNRVARFDKATLTNAKLGADNGARTVLRGATFNGATLDGADLTQADLGPVDPNDPSTAAQFVGAKMNRVSLSRATLAGAKLAGAFLHGANLAGAALKGADLTGAQLGSLAPRFEVAQASPHYRGFLEALRRGDGPRTADVFGSFDHPLTSGAGAEVKALVPERSWTANFGPTHPTYTVLHWTSSKGDKSLIVSTDTTAATLTGAYMPNARLTDANLSGVAASGLQLYGDVRLDGAILDGCMLSHANLAGSGLGVKALYNVDLSYANLINTKIAGVDLTHHVVLSYASLQGADFTDSHLGDANLEYAAVSVKLTGTYAGTYLFKISDPTSVTFKDVLAELTAAADAQFPVVLAPGPFAPSVDQCVSELSQGNVDNIGKLFEKRELKIPEAAKIQPTTEPDAWQVVSSTTPGGFNVWRGFTKSGADAVLTRPRTPRLQELFNKNKSNAGTLRWQSTVTRVGDGSNLWEIDNDSANPKNFQLGYVKILVSRVGDALVFYGTTLHIERLADDNSTQIVPVALMPTILGPKDSAGEQHCGPDGSGSYFGPGTVCPNASTLDVNQSGKSKIPWEEMLRAPESPAPPKCVPSPNQYCPQVDAMSFTEAGDSPR